MRRTRLYGGVFLPAILAVLWLQLPAAYSSDNLPSGEIRGVVRFPSDMLIRAKAQLTEKQSGAQRETHVGTNGEFRFEGLPPGIYRLELSAWCLKTITREDIRVIADSRLKFDLTFSQCAQPEFKPAHNERFWTHAARKASTEEEKKLIELAEAVPCRVHWLAEKDKSGSPPTSCLNKETVEYYFSRVDSFRKSPSAQELDSQLSASANYEASVEFDKVRREWVVTLLLVNSYGCGNLCGNGSRLNCQVFFDEEHNLIKVIEGTDCNCGWIS
jgi:hypothetical protein